MIFIVNNLNTMGRFIIKKIKSMKPKFSAPSGKAEVKEPKNNINEKKEVMTTSEKVAMAQSVLNTQSSAAPFKRVKKDKGLIERTESSKTILTEDNKELLND